MSDFPSNKTYIITFAVLIVYLCLDFYFKSSKDFFQLNFNWKEAKVLKNFNNVQVDSIAVDYLAIIPNTADQINNLSNQNTFCLDNTNYFKCKRIAIQTNKVEFIGGFWINSMPKKHLGKTNIKEVDLQLIQKGANKVCMIGDSQLTYKTGKFTRKNLYLKLKNTRFVGTNQDLYSFPYCASTLNNSDKILAEGLDKIPLADVYIIFLGAHEKSLEGMDVNFKSIINQLQKRKSRLLLIAPPQYTNHNKKGISKKLREIYSSYKSHENVEFIDLVELIDTPELYLGPDGIHLNKIGHELLTSILYKYLKAYEN